ncbi:MAG TPA: hypothetical protein VL282_17260 [Tepidisphaeraceae bacterium]|nr:hypothetical protein [Tepidisphaeraceae bacterium]
MIRKLLLAVMLLAPSILAATKDSAYVEWWNAAATYPSNVTYLAPTDSTDQPKLKIEGSDQPTTTTVATIEHPPIAASDYQVVGQVWYSGVRGNGYLEMWSHFDDGNAYFTRTVDTSGPTGVLARDSNWRSFALPFHSQAGKTPTKLIINVVLPGKGTVKLSPLTVMPIPQMYAWWSDSTGGWIGGIAGSMLGCLGALVGILTGKAKAPRLVRALTIFMIAVGAIALVAGIFALVMRQPYAVYYPLLLVGVIDVSVMGFQLNLIKRRYAEHELRKMTALDTPS